jgi:hypothetical protein
MGGIIPDTQRQAFPRNVTTAYITLVKKVNKLVQSHINQSFHMRQSA